MRLFSTIAAAAFLATTPCMAQVVISGPSRDAGRSDYRAEQHREAVHEDMHAARERTAERDDRSAAHERAEAREHHEVAREQEGRGGVHLDVGR
jgi:hypothetical protein